ncbi:glycosyltransferase family 2 protein [Candidatus Macondimonas diazotrophica]|uniref:Glycosyltransferase n=1 Tax=Candidatus Macondimonas diazotrophica TaxID=2305248 RepID=A0A4Z0F9B6_9GAMM|nr:glycosyltransferase [Candidatus Macondimonas diazotrophica]NCU01149.1 glycosyltransferase [Candidatus Macondimonas diazotrophica]TFZ82272.1 glycosyltransferase [Candidatus Macondimonas diazotrophica]HBG29839.1 hypothetical protein [Gammaproteobacteria bacterium]
MAAQPARRLQPKIPTPASMPLRGRISDLPSISVIIPCLNEEGVVDGLIDDLLDNDYPHFEIIVCDSGSSDGTAAVVTERAQTDPRLRLVTAPKRGVSLARNTGASAAQGDYFVFLDADARVPHDYLEVAMTEIRQRVLAVATFYMRAGNDDRLCRLIVKAFNHWISILQYIKPTAPGASGFWVRRDLHAKTGGYDETLNFAEDLKYLAHCSRFGKFGVLRKQRAIINMRRFEQDGRIKTGLEWLFGGMTHTIGLRLRRTPFKYRFGHYSAVGTGKGRNI